MRSIYEETGIPPYLDARASTLLAQGRQKFHDLGLHERKIVSHDDSAFLFVWSGDRVINTIAVLLQAAGLRIQNHGVALQVPGMNPADLTGYLKRLVEPGPADPMGLARVIPNKEAEKFHYLLTEGLLCADYASSRLDTVGAWQMLANVTSPN
jgi:ATP-dependent Lhr-like helicase